MLSYQENTLLVGKLVIMPKRNKSENQRGNVLQTIISTIFKKQSQTNQKQSQNQSNQQQSTTQQEQKTPLDQQVMLHQMQMILMQMQQMQIQQPSVPKWKKVLITFGVLIVGAIGGLIVFLVESYTGGFINKIAENNVENVQELLDLPQQFAMYKLEDEYWKQYFREDFSELKDTVTHDHEDLITLLAIQGNNNQNYNATVFPKVSLEYGEKENEPYLSQPSWQSADEILGTSKSGMLHLVGDFYNTPVVLPCKDGNNEVFFYGQYNENYHWNGKCILNVYNEDKLVSICEAIYDDGNLYSYKSVFIDSDGNWRVNDRVEHEEFSRGETWTYRKTNNFDKLFSTENVTSEDILTKDNFVDWLESGHGNLIGYYKGDTANGLYEDRSGHAFSIRYFLPEDYIGNGSDPVIRTLYHGRFEEGKYKDDTYEAWYITRATNTAYMYFRGCFANNTANPDGSENEDIGHPPLSLSRIFELLEENHFTEDYKGEFLVDYEAE